MKIISPIAIDMGAKNTGVYYAKYAEGASFEQIDKRGEVLVYGKYTPLLKERTAKRHARRGYQRKKLAKRLLMLVLENYFGFPAKKHAQAIGFLLNRRGFTFLQDEYSKEHLGQFPEGAWKKLPDFVRKKFGARGDIAPNLEQFSQEDMEKIYSAIAPHNKSVRADLVYFSYIEKIKRACEERGNGNQVLESKKEKKKLSRTSGWIVARINKEKAIVAVENNRNVNLLAHINSLTSVEAQNLQKRLPDIEAKKQQAKQSDWNFTIDAFTMSEKTESALLSDVIRDHLHHLSYAIHQLSAGARHRRQYFKELKQDFKKFAQGGYFNCKRNPAYITGFVRAVNASQKLDMHKLHRVVCHISNLELKPLRAYFNDKSPVMRKKDYLRGDQAESNFISHVAKNGGDVFSNKKLSRVASTWFVKHWTVDKEKDDQKKVDSYRKLKSLWESHEEKDDIVGFWVKTEPELTIPPYQSMNNRRPPTCQSLVLNLEYLDEHYPHWEKWLDQLRPDDGYGSKLQLLQGKKRPRKKCGGRLIDDRAIKARQLQFALDASKKFDAHHLNEIWGICHKLKNLQEGDDKAEWERKLKDACEQSDLPGGLMDGLKNEAQGAFGHFVNKYYQTRKRARSGRYFLHQEKKNRWATDGKLFVICGRKPKQKEQQWRLDLAAILGVDPNDLKEQIGEQAPEYWLQKIAKNFEGACRSAAEMQKEHRGALKLNLAYANKREAEGKKPSKEDRKLLALEKKCKCLADQLAQVVHPSLDSKSESGKEELRKKAERFESLFSFAQIHNIVFMDRKGFSKTCPVCSVDNGFRMREVKVKAQNVARASRLPALSIRLIDGLVMRICDAVSRRIAAVCWERIAGDVDAGKKIRIPLIFEQNRFEFMQNLRELKRKRVSEDDRTAPQDKYIEKDQRIKKAAQGVCAYTGVDLGAGGEIDHIIPRSSRYGALNDEANLIYVSVRGNREKGNKIISLGDLSSDYKREVFGGKTDDEIANFIYEQLEDAAKSGTSVDADAPFAFGQYLSLDVLEPNQQLAFRHALFLQSNDPLKKKVIGVLQNRNRAIVNGTQRYMAQCIADKIHKTAKKSGKEKQIEFDYFEYTARANEENSTSDLRKFYREHDDRAGKPKKQRHHSHLIDAQMAFLLAAENHKSDGSMGLVFNELETIWQGIDMQTGEVLPAKFFNSSYIDEGSAAFSMVLLDRKKSKSGVRLHRSFHRPNFYAEHYVPLFLGKKDGRIEIKAGFNWEKSVPVPRNAQNPECIMAAIRFAKDDSISAWDCAGKTLEDLHAHAGNKTDHDGCEVVCIAWDKTKFQKHLVDEFSTESAARGKAWSAEVRFIRKLAYRTQKKKIETYNDVIETLNSEKKAGIFGRSISIPAVAEWQRLKEAWEQHDGDDGEFLRNYFLKRDCAAKQENRHQKKRRVFSLPVVDTGGHFLQKRHALHNQSVHQILADSDSRKDGNKFSRPVLRSDGTRSEVMNRPFISKNIFKLTEWTGEIDASEGCIDFDPNKWTTVTPDKDFPPHVEKIEYCIDTAARPKVKIHLADVAGGLSKESIEQILENPLTKARDGDAAKVKEWLQSGDPSRVFMYTAYGFNRDIGIRLLRERRK